MELDVIHNMDCLEFMKGMPDNCIDLVVTSPPYGNLRDYNGFDFDFAGIAEQLVRVLSHGGVVVWIVADQSINQSETGESFRQALGFMDAGFNLYDTMIYHRQAANPPHRKYWQNFEYMFVLSKGVPKTANIIRDRKNKYKKMGGDKVRQPDGSFEMRGRGGLVFNELGIRENIWYYGVGKGNTTKCDYAFEHPAMFPEKLAIDHIETWSRPGDIIFDPFMGSGTTAVACHRTSRRFIGCDISKEYCEIAERRVQDEKDNLGLFGGE